VVKEKRIEQKRVGGQDYSKNHNGNTGFKDFK
jgi:hypothetical protein